ncbi:14538_t:CDS:1, partial [Entrophospora sp. SA101]
DDCVNFNRYALHFPLKCFIALCVMKIPRTWLLSLPPTSPYYYNYNINNTKNETLTRES